jgi:hypothetical protein
MTTLYLEPTPAYGKFLADLFVYGTATIKSEEIEKMIIKAFAKERARLEARARFFAFK